MGEIKAPQRVMLVVSLFGKVGETFDHVILELKSIFGEIIFQSEFMPFDKTRYYEKEMGKDLYRKLIAFDNLIYPDELYKVKILTNEIEKKFSVEGKRLINIDPGILSLHNFILATTKNYTHRIYLKDGIYADLTLIFRNKEFIPLPWTYPDYASEKIRIILKELRKVYKNKL